MPHGQRQRMRMAPGVLTIASTHEADSRTSAPWPEQCTENMEPIVRPVAGGDEWQL